MPFESLSLGIEALRAAQGALSVIGHNIANINTEGYTRQRPTLETNTPQDSYPGQRGTGVGFTQIKRLDDIFTKLQINAEERGLGEYNMKSDLLAELEQVINEPSESGLQSYLSDFFNAFHTLANAPEDFGTRSVVVQTAVSLANKLSTLSTQLSSIQSQIDSLVINKVDTINSITDRMAALNSRITAAETGGQQDANDLRDERDLLLRKLNRIINVNATEDNNGNLLVEAQGQVLVAGTTSIPISTTPDVNGYLVPANANTSEQLVISGGEIKGLLDVRDQNIQAVKDEINTLALALIENVNRVHSQGTSLAGFESIAGTTTIDNFAEPMSNFQERGLPFEPTNGNFYITAFNETTGQVIEEQTIAVNPITQSVNDIINAVNTAFGTGNVVASMGADNKLTFTAANGVRLEFVEASTGNVDTSDFLLATGVNSFFEGSSAFSIAVSSDIQNNLDHVSAGRSLSPGDNTTALELANLQEQQVLSNNTASFDQFYASVVSSVGTDAQSASRGEATQESLLQLLDQRLTSTTGVSLDEEAANMLIFQRMFQAAAKYVQTMDEVLNTLINGI